MKQGFSNTKLPWEGREPLYEYVRKSLKKGKGIILGDDKDLPDNVPMRMDMGFYDPGCDDYWDLYANPEKEVNPKFIKRLVDLFASYSQRGKMEDKIKFYNTLKDNPIVGYWDEFLDELSSRELPYEQAGVELVHWMVEEAPDREVVKLGIILLGVMRDPENLTILKTMGRHDEFTYYVGQSLMQMTPMWDIILVDIIKPLCGFGRALAVMMLLYESEREEIRKWCVRHGFQKFYASDLIMWDCVEQGNMLKELRREEWDESLLEATQIVVKDLLIKGERGGGYKYGGEIIYLYLKHTIGKRRGYVQYLLLDRLAEYIEEAANNKFLISNLGFTEEEFSDVWIDVKREIKKPWFLKIKSNERPSEKCPYGTRHLCERAFERLEWGKD